MLMPHPVTLRMLVEEYEALAAEEAEEEEAANPTGMSGRRAQDLAYTLCVSTGTRDVRTALAVARRQLAEAAEAVLHQPVRNQPVRTPHRSPEGGVRAVPGAGAPAMSE